MKYHHSFAHRDVVVIHAIPVVAYACFVRLIR